MADNNSGGLQIAGIGTGGLLVIAGVLIALFGSNLLGLILVIVGLVSFGGFVKGKWY